LDTDYAVNHCKQAILSVDMEMLIMEKAKVFRIILAIWCAFYPESWGRVKKTVVLVFAFALLVTIPAACGPSAKIEFDFSVSDVENIEIYRYIDVPVNSQMKIVTETTDFQPIMDTFTSLKVSKPKAREPDVGGGSYYAFRFNLPEDAVFEIVCSQYGVGDFDIKSSYVFEYSAAINLDDLWDSYDYHVQYISETQLPYYEK
jgi:hypothetical protein